MNNLPKVISVTRIILSICLLMSEPFKTQFWCICIICGLTDIADGHLARKLKTVSKTGAVLDSLGDLIFAVIIVSLVLLHVSIPVWGFIWIAAIVVIKLLSILVGYLKFQAFAALHTYANKAVGLLLFSGLPIYIITNNSMVMVFLLVAATLAAVEELLIVIKSKSLERNIKGIFK